MSGFVCQGFSVCVCLCHPDHVFLKLCSFFKVNFRIGTSLAASANSPFCPGCYFLNYGFNCFTLLAKISKYVPFPLYSQSNMRCQDFPASTLSIYLIIYSPTFSCIPQYVSVFFHDLQCMRTEFSRTLTDLNLSTLVGYNLDILIYYQFLKTHSNFQLWGHLYFLFLLSGMFCLQLFPCPASHHGSSLILFYLHCIFSITIFLFIPPCPQQ